LDAKGIDVPATPSAEVLMVAVVTLTVAFPLNAVSTSDKCVFYRQAESKLKYSLYFIGGVLILCL